MSLAGATPVTLLTGFLGSGKTTLLNRALADPRFRDTAVIVNEWGEAPIDHALLVRGRGEAVVLAGGCICCRMAGDLVRTLRELHVARMERRIADFSRVVVETTGLADPSALLRSLVELPVVASRYALGAVVAVVDAEHGARTLDAHGEARAQVAVADRLVIAKGERADPAAWPALEARLAALNPGAPRLDAHADPAGWLEAGLHRARGAGPAAHGWLAAGDERLPLRAPMPHAASLRTRTWRHPEPLRWEDVEPALQAMVSRLGARLLRMKGLVQVAGEPGPRAVHAVGHTLYPSARLATWPDAARGTTLVLVTDGLEDGDCAPILPMFPTPTP